MFSVAANVAPPSLHQDCDTDAVRSGQRGGQHPHGGGAGDGDGGGGQPAEEGEPQGAAAGVGSSPLLARGLASRSAGSFSYVLTKKAMSYLNIL